MCVLEFRILGYTFGRVYVSCLACQVGVTTGDSDLCSCSVGFLWELMDSLFAKSTQAFKALFHFRLHLLELLFFTQVLEASVYDYTCFPLAISFLFLHKLSRLILFQTILVNNNNGNL